MISLRYLIILFATVQTLSALASSALTITSYNIRNFPYDERAHIPTDLDKLKKIILKESPDIMAVQEITDASAFNEFIEQLNADYKAVLSSCGGANHQLLGFVYRTSKVKLVKYWQDMRLTRSSNGGQESCNNASRPLSLAKFELSKASGNKLQFIAATLHLKAGGRTRSQQKRAYQLNTLSTILSELESSHDIPLVILGDFNSTEYMNRGLDYQNMSTIVADHKLKNETDIFSCSSYWHGGINDGKEYPSLLDHILMSKSWNGHFSDQQVTINAHCARVNCAVSTPNELGTSYTNVSDHCPLSIRMNP